MFVTGSCGVSRTGMSVRAESTGDDVLSPSRNLLGRLGEEDEANQERFLGTSFVSGSGRLAVIIGVGGSEIGKFVGMVSGRSSVTAGEGIAAAVVEWETG
jgi:hypothetical protein